MMVLVQEDIIAHVCSKQQTNGNCRIPNKNDISSNSSNEKQPIQIDGSEPMMAFA
jgi:hypothetical protein